MTVRNKVAIVTGGGSGIGRAAALAFAGDGASVVVADVNADAARRVREEIVGKGGVSIDVPTDVSDAAAVRALVEKTQAVYGRIDVLMHAAGICPRNPFLEMTDDEWRRVQSVNLDGTFYVTRDVARVMASQRSGTMILVTSDRGLYGSVDYAHYAASKGAMIALTKSLALTLGKFGVTVNGINPGLTDTPLGRAAVAHQWDAKLGLDVLGKASRPEEIGELVLFLAGKGGAFMTGQIVGARMRYGA